MDNPSARRKPEIDRAVNKTPATELVIVVNQVKALWASVMGNPVLFKKINGWLTLFWIVMVPVSVILGWVSSVEYVSALSIYALVTGHLSTWQAARVEVKQEEMEQRQNDAE